MRLYCILLFFLAVHMGSRAQSDSAAVKDSIRRVDSITSLAAKYKPVILKLLDSNRYLNSSGTPAAAVYKKRTVTYNNVIFYVVTLLLLLFGILKTSFAKYFNTLFRVFFNTSLRQSQLIDQLQQNKLASLFFNIFFSVTGGLYISLLLHYFGLAAKTNRWKLFAAAAGILTLVYFIKFLVTGFVGWITNYKEEAGTYVFNIFLINKVIGICLLPVVVVMSFSEKIVTDVAVVSSFIIIGLLVIMRFIRSYSLLQHRLKFNLFHFLLYVFSLEVLPIMLIYKSVVLYLTGNQ
ncbi:MAG: DUF4271 domain-containing protein [Ferruginibacter sp.]